MISLKYENSSWIENIGIGNFYQTTLLNQFDFVF